MPRPPLLVVAYAAALAACGSADVAVATDARTRRDTIGDTVVVRNTGSGSWGDSLHLVEELRIGDAAGSDAHGFAFVGGIAVDSRGTITVADLQMRSVRQYDADGRFLRQIGREGSGPGEYRAADALTHLPDGRLIVRDVGNRRINVYTADGQFIDAWPLPSSLSGLLRSLQVDESGRINAVVVASHNPLRTGWLRMDTTGRILDTLRPPAWTEQVPNAAPYEIGEAWSLHPSGTFVGGVNDRFAVHLLYPDRTVRRIERTDVPTLEVPDGERTELETRREDGLRRSREPPSGRPLRPVPATKPAYRYAEGAADGRIWVSAHLPSIEREVTAPDSVPISERPRRWSEPAARDLFDPDGTYLGRLRLPPGARLHFMRGDHVWGTMSNDLDVPYLLRWRIARP